MAGIPVLAAHLQDLEHARGRLRVDQFKLDGSVGEFRIPLNARAYCAALQCPRGWSAFLVITVLDDREVDEDWLPPHSLAKWQGQTRRVDSLWGMPYARYKQGDGLDSLAVAVGKRLFELGCFTEHSVNRTVQGDKWARKVGGKIPPFWDKRIMGSFEADFPELVKLLTSAYSGL